MSAGLARSIGVGFLWSTLSNLGMRIGGVAIGIVLARILTPTQFGVYAVALTVQAILINLADPGLTGVLIRSEQPKVISSTVGALGLAFGTLTSAIMALTAPMVAEMLGAKEAASIIGVLSLTLVFAGAGTVPLAMLQRSFAQNKLFLATSTDFVMSTAVTLLLVVAGYGPMALAVGRVVGQFSSTTAQFILVHQKPSFSIDRALLRPIFAFGAPLAVSNLVSWVLINLDYIVIARMMGAEMLGYYVLAFNVASWPMNALGQAIRNVALPGFSRVSDPSSSLLGAARLAWSGGAGMAAILGVLAAPLISTMYGDRWLLSAPVLSALAALGAMRVLFDVFSGYLLALGQASRVLAVNIIWCLILAPALIIGVSFGGIVGAGWAHVIVGGIVLVVYLLVLRSAARLRLLNVTGLPSLPAIAAGISAYLVLIIARSAWAQLVFGGLVGGVALIACTLISHEARIRLSAVVGISSAKKDQIQTPEKAA